MSGVLHICFFGIVVFTIADWGNLVNLKHRFGKLCKVSTSNNENFSIIQTNLDGLEVMRKILVAIDRVSGNTHISSVKDKEFLRVFFHYVDLQRRQIIDIYHLYSIHLLWCDLGLIYTSS